MAVSALQGPLFPNAFDGMDGRQKVASVGFSVSLASFARQSRLNDGSDTDKGDR